MPAIALMASLKCADCGRQQFVKLWFNARIVRGLADLRSLVGWFRCLGAPLLLLCIAGAPKVPFAQESWVFTTGIACPTAPIYGLTFSQCWASNVRNFRVGNVQAWRLLYSDSKSEVAVGFYKLVEAHGVGGIGQLAASNMIDWLRTADALKNVTSGASGWALSGSAYVTFQKANRQCIGFVRNGPATSGQINWVLGATFCRESASTLSPSEAQFIDDAVQVRD
jgi:hypothetical protein